MELSLSRLYNTDDRMINEHRAVGGIKIIGENEALGQNLHQCHFLHHTYHRAQPGIKSRLLQLEASD
jgi:hypothetical protein